MIKIILVWLIIGRIIMEFFAREPLHKELTKVINEISDSNNYISILKHCTPLIIICLVLDPILMIGSVVRAIIRTIKHYYKPMRKER